MFTRARKASGKEKKIDLRILARGMQKICDIFGTKTLLKI